MKIFGRVAKGDREQHQRAALNTIGRRWDLSARLDLRDPDVAAAWSGFRRDPTSARAIGELGMRLRTQARLDARVYAVRSASDGAGAEAALGVKLGGELDRTTERARLLAASTRPPGGLWERRPDCL